MPVSQSSESSESSESIYSNKSTNLITKFSNLLVVKKFGNSEEELEELYSRNLYVKKNFKKKKEKYKKIFENVKKYLPNKFSLYYVQTIEKNLSNTPLLLMLIYIGPNDSIEYDVIRIYDEPFQENTKMFIVKKIAILSGFDNSNLKPLLNYLAFTPSPSVSQGSYSPSVGNVSSGSRRKRSPSVVSGRNVRQKLSPNRSVVSIYSDSIPSSNPSVVKVSSGSSQSSIPSVVSVRDGANRTEVSSKKDRPYWVEPSINLKKLIVDQIIGGEHKVEIPNKDYYITTVFDDNTEKYYLQGIIKGDTYRQMKALYDRHPSKGSEFNEHRRFVDNWKFITDDIYSKSITPDGTTWSDEIHNFLLDYYNNPKNYKSEGQVIQIQ